MRSAGAVGVVLVMAVAACHRAPEPIVEYGETVTYTSTANDAPPQAAAPAQAVAAPPAETSPPATAVSTGREGEWTTTVYTDPPPSGASRPVTGDEPAAGSPAPAASEAASPAPATSEPAAPAAPPRRWYKAKPW